MFLAILLALLILLVLAGALYEARAEAADRRRFPPPGRLVPSSGAELHLTSLGERADGRPGVVLENGQGSWSLAWRDLQPQIAAFARVTAYDRAGLGWSPPGPQPRIPQRMVGELHAALQAAGETGPFVLVGHGLGCALTRLYAARYPDDAAALVLVDPVPDQPQNSTPDRNLNRLVTRSRGAALLARVGLPRLARRRFFPAADDGPDQDLLASQTLNPHFFTTLADETQAFLQPDAWQGLPTSLGDLFLVIVAPEASGEALLGLSSRSHFVPLADTEDALGNHPEAVLAAVQAAVEIAALRPTGQDTSSLATPEA